MALSPPRASASGFNAVSLPFRSALRQHLAFVCVIPLLIVALTLPAAPQLLDAQSLWLPTDSDDHWFQLWNTWYFKRLLAGQGQPLWTDLQFHPLGMSLAFHVISLPYAIVSALLQLILPPLNAHSLSWMAILLLNSLSAYLCLLRLSHDRRAALVGAVVFALNPFTLANPQHPELYTLFTVPPALACFWLGLERRRWQLLAWAGLWLGISAYIGLYTFLCLLLSLPLLGLFQLPRRWRDAQSWRGLLALLLLAGAISAPRISPMLADSAQFSEALDKSSDRALSTDLLAFALSARHPLTQQFAADSISEWTSNVDDRAYLGLLPLALIALGLARGRQSQARAWLMLLLLFFLLRLGTSLQIAGAQYADIPLPKHYAESLLPWLFRPFWNPANFQIGMLFPMAVLVAKALPLLKRLRRPRFERALPFLLIALIAFEYYGALENPVSLPAGQLDYIEWLAAEERQEAIHLINLPFGRRQSKFYSFIQTLTGYPHAEGVANRLPREAYAFIEGNAVLRAWRARQALPCNSSTGRDALAALQELEAVGFTHIVAHRRWIAPERIFSADSGLAAAYHDDFVTIYRLETLLQNCASEAPPGQNTIQGEA